MFSLKIKAKRALSPLSGGASVKEEERVEKGRRVGNRKTERTALLAFHGSFQLGSPPRATRPLRTWPQASHLSP